jgi:hypothetical protein
MRRDDGVDAKERTSTLRILPRQLADFLGVAYQIDE